MKDDGLEDEKHKPNGISYVIGHGCPEIWYQYPRAIFHLEHSYFSVTVKIIKF